MNSAQAETIRPTIYLVSSFNTVPPEHPRQRKSPLNTPNLIEPEKINGKEQEERVAKKGKDGNRIGALGDKTATVNVQTPSQVNTKGPNKNHHQAAQYQNTSLHPQTQH
jgi:hypothetical protein